MNPIQDAPAPVRWSTDDVDQRHSLGYWVDTVCGQFLELRVDTPLRGHFRASFERAPLGAATFNVFRAERQRVLRTAAEIARSDEPMFLLVQPRRGDIVFRQLGREVQVRPGECVLMNSAEPYEVECPQPHMAAGIRMPAAWLRRWIPYPERHPAATFSTERWSAALCAALGSLDIDTCGELALPQHAVAEQIAALLALSLGRSAVGMRSSSLHEQLLRTLRDRMHESEVSAQTVAADHHISERSLFYAFANAGTTFAAELLRLRLERAHELLSDPRLCDMPIVELASRCGFIDPSHFARRFRRRFGHSPTAYRKLH